MADMCKELASVLSNADADADDKKIFAKLKAKNAEEDDVKNAIKTVMRMMHTVCGRKVILLLDEYDVPLARASEENSAENQYYSSPLSGEPFHREIPVLCQGISARK
ncbi:MAG: AAA family ATPase [Lachnospiraceae bacterium]|nr:AAA family ATPase [Lachnospiraceae bacterium]